jgi:cytochrome c-type biogenesis protein CcmE
MNPIRKKRLTLIGLMLAAIGVATVLLLKSFDDNLMFFFSPSEVVAGEAPSNHAFRVGGLVSNGSVTRLPNGLTTSFDVTDNDKSVTVEYTGILPDLFREGQGIVAMGALRDDGVFVASEVLAKHDENYMPPEVADSLKTAHAEGVAKAAMEGAQ